MKDEMDKATLDCVLNDTNFRFSDYYHYCSLLGKGAFGLVVEAVSKSTLENMAVKVGHWLKFRSSTREAWDD
jgi:hypothetical protein